MLRAINDDRRCQEAKQSGESDFPSTVRPLAVDFAGARVDQHLIGPIPIAIGEHPDRQQNVLERDRAVLGPNAVDLLLVTPDALSHILLDRRIDLSSRDRQAVFQLDVVSPRNESCERFLRKWPALFKGPWLESVD